MDPALLTLKIGEQYFLMILEGGPAGDPFARLRGKVSPRSPEARSHALLRGTHHFGDARVDLPTMQLTAETMHFIGQHCDRPIQTRKAGAEIWVSRLRQLSTLLEKWPSNPEQL